MARGLYGTLSGLRLRPARLPEEIKVGYSHSDEGDRVGPQAAGGRGTRLQSKARGTMKTRRKTVKNARVTEGSGNVFADLGLANADQELMKSSLTLQIYHII